MPSLAEFQFAMVADLLDGGQRTTRLLSSDPAAVIAALRIHRNTVLAGLARALRLTFPTVAWLTGEDFFEQAAIVFASVSPPRDACLSNYGDGFADFLETYPPAMGLPYLADVARFDLVVERCANAPATALGRMVALEGGISLALSGSLIALTLEYPVNAMRDARDDDDADRLTGLDMTPRAHNFAMWHGKNGVSMRVLSEPSAIFLGALLRGECSEAALANTLMHSAPDEALAAIQAEILAAPFTQILSQAQGE